MLVYLLWMIEKSTWFCIEQSNSVILFYFVQVITGHNEVVAKVMFLHMCVILFTGGLQAGCPGTRQTPHQAGRTPRDQADTPPDQADTPPGPDRHPRTRQTPPWTRQTPPRPGRHPPRPGRHPPRDQTDTPGPGRHPPGPGRHPPRPGRYPPRPGRPPDQADTSLGQADTPRWEEYCSIRSMSGRYASYWNAFLFVQDDFVNKHWIDNGQ